MNSSERIALERQEIMEIIADLNDDIKEIGIKIIVEQVGYSSVADQALLFMGDHAAKTVRKSEEIDCDIQISNKPTVLVLSRLTHSRSLEVNKVKIADWQTNYGGYPCTIKFSHKLYNCHNKKAIEDSLLKLLENPDVGKLISELSR